MGKTALALSMARNSAVEFNHKVGIFSLEMSNQQLAERLITSEARVDSHLVRTGRLPKSEWKNLAAAAGTLSEASIYIDDSASLNILELRAKAESEFGANFDIKDIHHEVLKRGALPLDILEEYINQWIEKESN